MAVGIYKKLQSRGVGFLGPFQVLCYLLSVFFGLLVTIPVGVTLRNFHGKCILYAQVVWDNAVVYPWSEPSCDFVLYMTLAVGIVYSALMAIFTTFAILPRSTENPKRFGMVQAHNVRYILLSLNPAFVFIDCIIFTLMLASALIISTGLGAFCSDLVQSMEERGTPIGSCINSKSIDWMTLRVEGGFDHGINGASFYGAYSVASIAAWCLVVVWALMLIGDFSQCCRGCVCQKAVEKQKLDKSIMIAARRSRLATPIGTPGHITPRSYGQVPLAAQGPHHGYYSQQHLHVPPKY